MLHVRESFATSVPGVPSNTCSGNTLHDMQVYCGVLDAAAGIVRQRGIAGLYSGLGVTMIEIMPYAALQFGLYDTFKLAWQRAKVCVVMFLRVFDGVNVVLFSKHTGAHVMPHSGLSSVTCVLLPAGWTG